MHRCFAPPASWSDDGTVRLTPCESHHLCTVLRVQAGGTVAVFDGAGRLAQARVEQAQPDAAMLRVMDSVCAIPCGGTQVSVIQALPKGHSMDAIIEKCTEIGVASIYPVTTARCVVRLSPDQALKRAERWARIAVSAAKQCRTPVLPAIAPVGRLADVPADLFDCCLVATLAPGLERLHAVLDRIKPRQPDRVAVVIGPEGDLTADEVARLVQAGAIPVSFGGNTLRVETAAVYAASVLTYELSA